MRGAHTLCHLRQYKTRIIPADAGSTVYSIGRQSPRMDHPRGCGEHGVIYVGGQYDIGSSPRMRGAQSATTVSTCLARDHPRGCGEHYAAQRLGTLSAGSSPRMRGAHTLCHLRQYKTRIIPADAGSTVYSIGRQSPRMDHPRGCGEHGVIYVGGQYDIGSSPRMRGAQSATTVSTCLARDHPRGCGEH